MEYWLRSSPALLSGLLLSAHFLRQGSMLAALICLGLPAAAVIMRRDWALLGTRLLLWTGCLLWLLYGFRLAQDRAGRGEPWHRLACILGSVAVWTALSAWLLGGKTVRARMRASAGS